MKHQVPVSELRIGMFVEELDRPWTETPFLFQGFEITSEEDIEKIKRYCDYIYVSNKPEPEKTERPAFRVESATLSREMRRRLSESEASFLPDSSLLNQTRYSVSRPFESEIGRAADIRTQSRKRVETLFEDVRMGSGFNSGYVVEIISDLTDSVLRNPDAHMLLGQLKKRDDYAASHAMNVCSLTLAFGRHLGLPQDTLTEIGMGAMLIDIGTLKIPDDILNKKGSLTKEEFDIVKNHVDYGVQILESVSDDIPPAAIDVVYTHHERCDGSGYPRGLTGDVIPLHGRIVGIVDTYDAMTTNRIHQDSSAPTRTLRELYEQREGLFDRELVESFIQFLGIYPVGTLVECSTGQVGIVVAQNPRKRLLPKLLLILDKEKKPYPIPKITDISQSSPDEQIRISRIVQPDEYDIDLAHYLDDFSWVKATDRSSDDRAT